MPREPADEKQATKDFEEGPPPPEAVAFAREAEAAVQLGAAAVKEQAQAFFEDYALQARKPHFGPVHREVITEILKRAEEKGLYTPKQE